MQTPQDTVLVSEEVLNQLADRMQEHFVRREQAIAAARYMVRNDMRMDGLPNLTQVQSMNTQAMLDVLRFCPESKYYYEPQEDTKRLFYSKAHLRSTVAELVRTKSLAYDLHMIPELSERSTPDEIEEKKELLLQPKL